MRGVGRVGVALDVTCGGSGLERFEWAAYIVAEKARKHVTGTLFWLPDEHCWLLGCLTTAGHLESCLHTPPWRAPTPS